MSTDFNDKVYLGYVFDDKGYHSGSTELIGVKAVADFICNNRHLNENKMITDVLDLHIVNTIGFFIDRFGITVDSEERKALQTAILNKREKLGL